MFYFLVLTIPKTYVFGIPISKKISAYFLYINGTNNIPN